MFDALAADFLSLGLGVQGALLLGSKEQLWSSMRPRWAWLIIFMNFCCSSGNSSYCIKHSEIKKPLIIKATRVTQKDRTDLSLVVWYHQKLPVCIRSTLCHRNLRCRAVMVITPWFLRKQVVIRTHLFTTPPVQVHALSPFQPVVYLVVKPRQ